MFKTQLGLIFALVLFLLAGCASSTVQTASTASGASKPPPPTEVPRLKVAIDCGGCAVRPVVRSLIIEGYNEAAAKAGHQVSATKEANLVIKEYTARSDAARFLAGAFAGKDEIKAVVSFEGKSFSVEDYYLNAWLGIEVLAKKIGAMTHAGIGR